MLSIALHNNSFVYIVRKELEAQPFTKVGDSIKSRNASRLELLSEILMTFLNE